ncbi:CocE/NonD family hydrolase [Aestuariicella hydrocarbonica]|uniref:CocE/NonD family hydrolase n=1 Tax=Pseudomaricurvus hydrocarbonicus TaxID=1470433 RepID=A0A9E5MQ71_9GAMM|nr:CocE/NonD family hydrolase [Aestuariicella hydrocarbonica]NHO68339.1 CocE/NonD family hydrolase [Aestuariicella hydrocarbonica]
MTQSSAPALSPVLTGVFAGPIAGLKYQTPTLSGITTDNGEFQYRANEAISFMVGGIVLGSVEAAPRLNLAQLANRVDGKIDKLHDPSITNLARFVHTLDQEGNIESGVKISPQVHELIGSTPINFSPPVMPMGQAGGDFADDPTLLKILETLNATPGVFTAKTPRTLCEAASSRNELRRNIRGIIKTTDVRIPLRDGTYVCADVFRPAEPGRYPVVMSQTFYGKSFYHDCICNEADAISKEEMEDRYFSGNPDGAQYENHENVDSSVWVPEGYVCIRVDARGVGNSQGEQAPFSVQEAEDYYDAIEWAGTQPWSNGNVGLWGMSYLAMTQHHVASLQPPHLKAMIAQGTDSDIYNEALYGGGIFGSGFWNWWWKIWSGNNHCGERRETPWMARVLDTPFNDPEAYGTNGSIFMRPDMSKATAPVWIVGPQVGAIIHQLGSSETFIRSTASKARKFDFTDAWFPDSYSNKSLAEHIRYFDYWLKGIDNGVMDEAPVRVQVRTGNGAHFVLHENEWPIARTEYRRWYFDARPSTWQNDERRPNALRISETVPTEPSTAEYDAHLDLGTPTLAPAGSSDGTPRWSTGISFVSEPMSEDMTLAGYMKVGLWVESSSADMDVFVSFRVLDEHDKEIRYESVVLPVDPVHIHPVGHGLLKVSRRKLDVERSTEYWPVHTHLEEDEAPLQSGEVVPVEIGLNPSTALIRKGHRLLVDIQPYAPAGVPVRAYDESYHIDAVNKIYTGPEHPSYLQLPIIP